MVSTTVVSKSLKPYFLHAWETNPISNLALWATIGSSPAQSKNLFVTFSSVSLNLTGDFGYEDLIIDNNNNLYAFKFDDAIGTSYIPRLVSLNQTNGTATDLIQTTLGASVYGFVYNKGTNEIIAITTNDKLLKFNLTTNTYSSVNLSNTTDGYYENLVIN